VVVGKGFQPGHGCESDLFRVGEQRVLECGVRDDGKVGHGQHPSAFIAVGGVEDGELCWMATGDVGLLGHGAGDGVGEPFALVQERAWSCPLGALDSLGPSDQEHGQPVWGSVWFGQNKPGVLILQHLISGAVRGHPYSLNLSRDDLTSER
jgi:hypothetical protein